MLCPICNLDLTHLDPVSRTEHVNICLEGGPTTSLAFETNGHLIGAKQNEPSKQRIICPVCSKTFQQVYNHFKLCAFKNDIPPHLLMEYWDKINAQLSTNKETTKPFPREILDNFILKCMKEGRVGADVEYAQALSMSLAESDTRKTKKRSQNNAWSIQLQPIQPSQANIQPTTITQDESSMESDADKNVVDDECTPMVSDQSAENQSDTDKNLVSSEPAPPQPSIILNPSNCVLNMMRNETKKQMINQTTQILTDSQTNILLPQGNSATMLTLSHLKQAGTNVKSPKKRRLELISDEDKCSTVQLRVDRELAASKYWRRLQAYRTEGDSQYTSMKPQIPDLWYKSRLSVCDIASCQVEGCNHDDLIFVVEEFRIYSSILDTKQHGTIVENAEESTEVDIEDPEAEIMNDLPSLSHDLLSLVNKQFMADLLIKSGYTSFYAHKLIWFTRTFKNNRPTMTMDGLPTIDMSDFSPNIIKHFLNFIYGSILPALDSDILDDLKSLASRLGCQNLVDMINSSIRQKSSELSIGSQRPSSFKVFSCPPISNS